jgi:hypothetical protein
MSRLLSSFLPSDVKYSEPSVSNFASSNPKTVWRSPELQQFVQNLILWLVLYSQPCSPLIHITLHPPTLRCVISTFHSSHRKLKEWKAGMYSRWYHWLRAHNACGARWFTEIAEVIIHCHLLTKLDVDIFPLQLIFCSPHLYRTYLRSLFSSYFTSISREPHITVTTGASRVCIAHCLYRNIYRYHHVSRLWTPISWRKVPHWTDFPATSPPPEIQSPQCRDTGNW